MITPKEAVDRAEQTAKELFEGQELRHLRLEEITFGDDDCWHVTLGWVEPAVQKVIPPLGIANAEVLKLPRVYKVFRFSSDGAFQGMTIRDVG